MIYLAPKTAAVPLKQRSELEQLSMEDLKALYIQETQVLHDLLLQGTPWEEAETQRKYVSAIGVLIDIRSNSFRVS